MRPVDTMPKEGRFLVRYFGKWRDAEWFHGTLTICGVYGENVWPELSMIDAWSPTPDANARVVTRAELEKLISAAIRFGSCSEDAMPKFQAALDSAKKAVGLE